MPHSANILLSPNPSLMMRTPQLFHLRCLIFNIGRSVGPPRFVPIESVGPNKLEELKQLCQQASELWLSENGDAAGSIPQPGAMWEHQRKRAYGTYRCMVEHAEYTVSFINDFGWYNSVWVAALEHLEKFVELFERFREINDKYGIAWQTTQTAENGDFVVRLVDRIKEFVQAQLYDPSALPYDPHMKKIQ